MKYFWYIASYDKTTGEHVASFPITAKLAKALLRVMGYKAYQDVYDVTSEGFIHLARERYSLAPIKMDYQLEVWSGVSE